MPSHPPHLRHTSISIYLTFLLLSLHPHLTTSSTPKKSLSSLPYQTYPNRKSSEAAVIEWGHSAIISAVDAVVASFGSQPHEGALFEVEAAPVLAQPLDGVGVLVNCEEVRGNIVVMSYEVGKRREEKPTFLDLALKAMDCEAAALTVVLLTPENEDAISNEHIFSMTSDDPLASTVDIPCIMISLMSANNLLASADSDSSISSSLPRVRLYAGGDRPFFEDISQENPHVYLIHNLLLNDEECDYLINLAGDNFKESTGQRNYLEGEAEQLPNKHHTSSVHIWKGVLQDPTLKAIEDRIEGVTGYPHHHQSDFTIERQIKNDSSSPSYQQIKGSTSGIHEQRSTLYIFLSDSTDENPGGELIFPAAKPPIKIVGKKGMGVVFNNIDINNGGSDKDSIHGQLRVNGGVRYVAKKVIYTTERSIVRRGVLPVLFAINRGVAFVSVKWLHELLVTMYGLDVGDDHFEKVISVFALLLVAGVLGVGYWLRGAMAKSGKSFVDEDGKKED